MVFRTAKSKFNTLQAGNVELKTTQKGGYQYKYTKKKPPRIASTGCARVRSRSNKW